MKLKLNTPILDYENNKIPLGKDGYFDLRLAITNAVNPNGSENHTAESKAKMFGISIRVYQNKEVDLTKDDIDFVIDMAGKNLPALVYGRLCELLEYKDKA